MKEQRQLHRKLGFALATSWIRKRERRTQTLNPKPYSHVHTLPACNKAFSDGIGHHEGRLQNDRVLHTLTGLGLGFRVCQNGCCRGTRAGRLHAA